VSQHGKLSVIMVVMLLAGCGTAARPPVAVVPPATATSTSPSAAGVNATDVMFVQMMLPHHRQGIQIVRIAKDREPREEVRGRLINLGSQQGIVTSPGDLPYGVSKAGAIYITRQIAVDYAKHLIVCNCISPGKIVTGAGGLAQDPARLEYQRRRTPWPRFGRPQDVANAAVFLASDRASFITGSNLVIDGGWLAG